jgi:N6-adenosine-specific RNA methylase IME4
MARKLTISLMGQHLLEATRHWGTATLPPEETALEWANYGIVLGRAERLLAWETGDWWNRGERYGDRVKIVTDPNWTGPSYQTCRNYGRVASVFPLSRRRDNLSFGIHEALAGLPVEEIEHQLTRLENARLEVSTPASVRAVRQAVKNHHRDEREAITAWTIDEVSKATRAQRYGVILADPPWAFEPYSQLTGMDRAAANHYDTMATEDICAIEVPAADNCVLFLWRTAPMMLDAIAVMQAWGFTYKTEIIWAKDRIGTGYWARNQHEVMMIGTKGSPVAPGTLQRPHSLVHADTAGHSVKPEEFYHIIEVMFPTTPKIEMFARRFRRGWAAYGNTKEMEAAE